MESIVKYVLCLCFCGALFTVYGQQRVSLTVKDSLTGRLLEGYNISINGKTIKVNKGNIELHSPDKPVELICTHVGYGRKKLFYHSSMRHLVFDMLPAENQLEEVQINTGYQKLSKERQTGSFEVLSKGEIQRSVSSNILTRLEDMTTAISFDRRNYDINNPNSSDGNLDIRGISSISGSNSPLIIVDNFPYEAGIENINPNDIENITILKDAAASSIWGAKAGNGVIVITTKKGKKGSRESLNFSSNLSIGAKPDLFKLKQISSSEFIDMEILLFDKGYYNNQISNKKRPALSPVIELLQLRKEGKLNEAELGERINTYRDIDSRRDYMDYFYRNSFDQRYAIDLSGGSDVASHYVSLGVDRQNPALRGNVTTRYTFNFSNELYLGKKATVQSRISYTYHQGTDFNDGYGAGLPLYPYAKLVGENGAPLAVNYGYSRRFLDGITDSGLLDWKYRPYGELQINDQYQKSRQLLFDLGMTYKITRWLGLEARGQYGTSAGKQEKLNGTESYFTRNLINLYTTVKDGLYTYGVPKGGILNRSESEGQTKSFRIQLNQDKNFAEKHRLTSLMGFEVRSLTNSEDGTRLYCYEPEKMLFASVDQIALLPTYNNIGGTASLGTDGFFRDRTVDRYVSIYGNVSYSYRTKIDIYFSSRKDASNLFGATTNGRWSPLWSTGMAWNIHRENFFKADWIKLLKVRGSFGYSGNVNRNTSAYSTIEYASYLTPYTSLPFAMIVNPPNPSLRWERVKTTNIGLDFATKDNRISGSLDYYLKNAYDLLGSSPLDPTTGISEMTINSANTKGKGLDLNLRSRNLIGDFSWNTALLLSFNKVVVSKYMQAVKPAMSYIQQIKPIEGQLAYAVFSYKWAGLNPENGNPMGYVGHEKSEDWKNIIQKTELNELVLHGSARPLWFGSVRNDWSYKNIQVSANIGFRFRYYFRKPTVNYAQIGTWNPVHADFSTRWQHPGDEILTDIPSFTYPNNSYRNNFFNGAAVNVMRGDHIRLADLRLAYELKGIKSKRIQSLSVFLYMTNLGFIWRANNAGIDPMTPQNEIGLPKTVSMGVNVKL
ncbi:SusC/RagA family TonB-linked outer membrane protein [Sphingobacterium prati]|uniref:SusC/RagA family TonB-linked outer membrane protein n=1 Tax=Sphingobacterium prati TaxID=2737006 RepID=UPI001556BFBD|nr:SusC/RagA family TonB-linked outer membrane protein [Sphingobacterium prati]NPE48464.1 SusC/RagA family TonB-linked outer membrane protein [Sphingobacterium prati]